MKIILNTFYTKKSELRRWKDAQNQLIVHFTGREGFPDSSVGKEFACNAGDPQFDSWVRKIPWRRDRLPNPAFLGFPCGSAGKEYACNVGDLGLIPGLGRSPGEGKDYGLQYPGLENSMDYSPWYCRVGHDWATFTSLQRERTPFCSPLSLWNLPYYLLRM